MYRTRTADTQSTAETLTCDCVEHSGRMNHLIAMNMLIDLARECKYFQQFKSAITLSY